MEAEGAAIEWGAGWQAGELPGELPGERIDRALATIAGGIDELFAVGVEPVDAPHAGRLILELERQTRRLQAAQLELLGDIERRCLHRADGHMSAKAMMRHLGGLSTGEAAARHRAMRMLPDLPEVRRQYRAGLIGTQQVQLLGRVHANPRVRHAMGAFEPRFVEQAERFDYRGFELRVREWERLVDADGPEPANERAHQHRDAKLIQNPIDLSWDLTASYAAMMGASMRDILDRYIDAETLADWEKARANHGAAACAADLARTEAQRRADALWQLFQDAASAPGSAVPVGFVHNVVWSAEAYEEMLRRIDGEAARAPDVHTYRCETLDGAPLEPTEAVVASLWGQVRRVVVDAKGEVIDQGRARCFTGAARHAVKLTATRCVWPGCLTPASRCEIDHLSEHARGGRTSPANGAPLCGAHNRWKQKGFAVHRDPAGDWHTTRPDGTEIS